MRIYAPNQNHNFTAGDVDFTNGVAAVPSTTAAEVIAYFTGKSYTTDANKHVLTVFDKMDDATLAAFAAYFGVTYAGGATKQTIVRAIETAISTAKMNALTVTSGAGTASGDTNIDVATAAEGSTLHYKIYDSAPLAAAGKPLFMDVKPASGWTAFTTNADITAATDKVIAVLEVNAAGYVVGYGSATVVAKA